MLLFRNQFSNIITVDIVAVMVNVSFLGCTRNVRDTWKERRAGTQGNIQFNISNS